MNSSSERRGGPGYAAPTLLSSVSGSGEGPGSPRSGGSGGAWPALGELPERGGHWTLSEVVDPGEGEEPPLLGTQESPGEKEHCV